MAALNRLHGSGIHFHGLQPILFIFFEGEKSGSLIREERSDFVSMEGLNLYFSDHIKIFPPFELIFSLPCAILIVESPVGWLFYRRGII
ncbi:MAG: hypothetical protein IKB16_07015 [Lentisphaeria bacterium]|nr:hypothetical protein [Lentisphaeria bacterium]